jgi:hypothetical protein
MRSLRPLQPAWFVLVFALSAPAWAQRTVPAVKLEQPPVIDGVVSAAEWKGAPRIAEGFDEQTGAPPPAGFEHEFWLAYDEKYIYIAGRLSDPEPNRISATETRTNVSVRSDDHVVFAIDTFGNLQNQNEFMVNPNGATQLRIAGGRAPKREWLGDILAKGRITEKGWEFEARIPWAIMQLPSPGARTLRADFGRSIQRTGRDYITSNVSGEQIQNVSRWVDVEVPRSDSKKVLKLLPFGYAGFDREGSDVIANSGLDMKSSLSDQLEFVGTINPDFRNIENDVLSLDFSYFERLAGESRPFFLEGEDYFRTSRDASLFASQRIRSFDTGWKLYGKITDDTRFAFLNTVDFGNQAAYVVNVAHQIRLRESFHVAGSFLSRPGLSNNAHHVSYGKGTGNHHFFAQYAGTDDDLKGSGHRFNTGMVYESKGVNAFVEYQEISPDFLPRLGFAPRVGFRGYAGRIEWDKPHPRGPIMETSFEVFARHQDDWEGDPFSKAVFASGSLTFRNNLDIDFGGGYEETEGFQDSKFGFSIEHPRGDAYRRWAIEYEWGNVAGKKFTSFGPRIAYRPLKNFQIQLRHQDFRHFEHETQTILSMNYELNQFDSLSSRLIRRDDDMNVYFAWRRAGNRGTEYYVILGDPNARSFRQTFIVKAVVPLELVLGR